MKQGDYVKVVKLSDEVFEGRHPNFVNKGYTVYGEMAESLEVGKWLWLNKARGDAYGWFHTSVVTEIIDENTFRTRNSIYHIEIIESKKEVSE